MGLLGLGRRANPQPLLLPRHLLSKRSKIPHLPGFNDLRMCPNLSNGNSEFGPRQQPWVLGHQVALVCFFKTKQADLGARCRRLLRTTVRRYCNLLARAGIYSFPVLEARSPQSMCCQTMFPLTSLSPDPAWPLPAAGGPRWPLTVVASLKHPPPATQGLPPSVSVSVSSPLLTRTPPSGSIAHPHVIASARTLFPNKVPFTGTGSRN